MLRVEYGWAVPIVGGEDFDLVDHAIVGAVIDLGDRHDRRNMEEAVHN